MGMWIADRDRLVNFTTSLQWTKEIDPWDVSISLHAAFFLESCSWLATTHSQAKADNAMVYADCCMEEFVPDIEKMQLQAILMLGFTIFRTEN